MISSLKIQVNTLLLHTDTYILVTDTKETRYGYVITIL